MLSSKPVCLFWIFHGDCKCILKNSTIIYSHVFFCFLVFFVNYTKEHCYYSFVCKKKKTKTLVGVRQAKLSKWSNSQLVLPVPFKQSAFSVSVDVIYSITFV